MPRVTNTFHVARPPAEVWAVLLDVARYAEWNPRLVRIDGAFAPGAVVVLHYLQDVKLVPGRFVVDVVACEPARHLAWRGPRNLARHLLSAVHGFRLAADGDGTRVTHEEIFTGVLAPLVWPVLGPIVAKNHAAVNAALVARGAR